MSFVYAEKAVIKSEAQSFPVFHIFSDTKLTFDDHSPNKANWGASTFKRVDRYGLVKSMIVAPKCCISFAGNDIAYAHKLLDYIFTKKSVPDEELLSQAFAIHKSAGEDKIEFIICTVDDRNVVHIACVKDGSLQPDCPQAWIGSYKVFCKLREQQTLKQSKAEQYTSVDMIQKAIKESDDTSVGGFIVDIRYDSDIQSFVYSWRLETSFEALQTVRIGEEAKIFGNAAEGGCTVEFRESTTDVVIDFRQGDFSIAYTNRYRYEETGGINDYTKYFMLPLFLRTSTNGVIESV